MSKAEYIVLMTFVGFYVLLCVALFLRAFVKSIKARFSVAPAPIEVVSEALDFKRSDRAWTRAVWRDTLA